MKNPSPLHKIVGTVKKQENGSDPVEAGRGQGERK